MTLPRRTPLRSTRSLSRRRRIPAQSAKRRREQKVRRDLSPPEGERCWLAIPGVCTGAAESWHELVGAGLAGSRVDPRNLCAACNRCNGWLEDNSSYAYARGWKVAPGWATRGDGGLVPAYLHPLSLAARKGDA